jgi:cobalamin biosynthesis protein CobT
MYELNKYVRSVAQEVGLHVSTSTKGYSYIQGKSIFIAPTKVPINQQAAVAQLRDILHEVAHYTDTDQEYWSKVPLKQDSMLRNIWNAVEDHRIEYVQSKRYDGDADILDAGSGMAFGRALKSGAEATGSTPEEQDTIDKMVAMLAFEKETREEWQPSIIEHTAVLNAKQEEYKAKLMKHADMVRKVRTVEGIEGTKLTHELARRLLEEMGGDAEKEEAEGQAAAAAGDATAGHGKDKTEGKGTGTGEKGEGDGDPINKLMDTLSTSPQDNRSNKYFDYGGGGKGGRGTGEAKQAAPNEFYIENYSNPSRNQTNAFEVLTHNGGEPHLAFVTKRYASDIANVRAQGSTSEQLAQKMRRLVQIKTRSRVQYGLKSGKLNGTSLHRIPANVPGYSERVFKRKQDHLDINAAVAVCVDMSGSMSGEKIAHAVVAAEMLSETVGNALGVPLMIYGFSETRSIIGTYDPAPSIFVLRDFTDRQVPAERMRERSIKAIACTMGNNPDADAVTWGYHQLRAAKGKRKVLFVLSDGSPASARAGDQDKYLAIVTKAIEQSPIKLFGLGLMDHSVKHYYKNCAVVDTAQDIETKIIELVDNFILEGN